VIVACAPCSTVKSTILAFNRLWRAFEPSAPFEANGFRIAPALRYFQSAARR
jgi:hypothetical protein